MWTLNGDEERTAASEPLLENESKHIRCVNALALNCCVYNMRTVLIVTARDNFALYVFRARGVI